MRSRRVVCRVAYIDCAVVVLHEEPVAAEGEIGGVSSGEALIDPAWHTNDGHAVVEQSGDSVTVGCDRGRLERVGPDLEIGVGGRRPKLNAEQIALAQELYDTGERTVREIADLLSVPRTTVYGHLDAASKGKRPSVQRTPKNPVGASTI